MGTEIGNKINEVSFLRPFFLFAIVFYHCLCYYSKIWNSVIVIPYYDFISRLLVGIGLGGFTCLSGYIFSIQLERKKYNKLTLLIHKKTKRIIIPYFIYGIITIITLKGQSFNNGPLHLWYLPFIFCCFIVGYFLYPLIRNLKSKVWDSEIIIYMLAIITFFLPRIKWNFISIYFSIYFPFFLLGMILPLLKTPSPRKYYPAIYIGIVIIYILTTLLYYTDFGNTYNSIIKRLILSILIILIYYCLIFSKNISTTPLINKLIWQKLNQNSMGIYLFHHLYLSYFLTIDTIIHYMNNYHYISPVIMFITIFTFSYISTEILKKNKYTKYLC